MTEIAITADYTYRNISFGFFSCSVHSFHQAAYVLELGKLEGGLGSNLPNKKELDVIYGLVQIYLLICHYDSQFSL